jgi:RimJ/RimL family protein N-acetyltransferase
MIDGLRRAPDAGLGSCSIGADFPWMQARVRAGLAGEGFVWVDDLDHPTVGIVIFGMAFLLGDAKHLLATGIVRNLPPMLSVIPPNDAWLAVVKSEWGQHFSAKTFWHFAPITAPTARDVAPPPECTIARIDPQLFEKVQHLDSDLCAGYQDFKSFSAHSKGYCALVDGKMVSAAALVAQHDGLAELTVYCDPRFRQRGIAQSTCANLLEACQKDGQKVYWEAANQSSCGLARKLGFTSARSYSVCSRSAS